MSSSVSPPLILYSTGTLLAFMIAERFYNSMHYVWCSPHFGPIPGVPYANPPSSSPGEIYGQLYKAVMSGDLHDPKIKSNKAGILRGALLKEKAGVITKSDLTDIKSIVKASAVADFRPVLFIVPFSKVAAILKPVPIKKRAHPLSEEFIIEALPRDSFDLILPPPQSGV